MNILCSRPIPAHPPTQPSQHSAPNGPPPGPILPATSPPHLALPCPTRPAISPPGPILPANVSSSRSSVEADSRAPRPIWLAPGWQDDTVPSLRGRSVEGAWEGRGRSVSGVIAAWGVSSQRASSQRGRGVSSAGAASLLRGGESPQVGGALLRCGRGVIVVWGASLQRWTRRGVNAVWEGRPIIALWEGSHCDVGWASPQRGRGVIAA